MRKSPSIRAWFVASRALAIALGIVAVAANPTGAQSRANSSCGTPEKRMRLRGKLEDAMVSTDSSATVLQRAYQLRFVPADSIVYVDDERICQRAAKEYYRYRLGPIPLGGVAVARVGEFYVVYGDDRAGEWTIMKTYTRSFEYLGAVGA